VAIMNSAPAVAATRRSGVITIPFLAFPVSRPAVTRFPPEQVYAVHLNARPGVRRPLVKVRHEADGQSPGEPSQAAQKPAGPRRARLNRERVLRAAVALADKAGIEALSMRNLAEELGVVPMA